MIALDVTSFYAAGAGGIRTYYTAKARHLPPRGVECHFVVPGARGGREQLGGAWLHRVAGVPLDRAARYRAFTDVRALWRVIDEVRPDVVEIGSHYVLPQLLAPALRRHRAAVVGFYHSDVPATYIAPRLQRAPRAVRVAALGAAWGWVRAQHRRYDATLAASRHTADALLAHGVPRVRWVGLGVELGAAPPRAAHVEPPRAVGYVGRLAADKELPLALAAAPAIRRATGARLVVAGDGPLLPRVARAAARGDVDHHGVVPARQIPALLGELRALVVPGRYESFGLAAAEALAAGVPVIAPDAGGAGELVAAAGCGVHFRAGDAQALADAVARVSRWPRAEWHAHAARGRRYAEDRLGWPAVMARIHAVYREVVSGGERARAAPEASA